MKKTRFFIIFITFSLVSCISMKPIPPEEIIYKEITAEEFSTIYNDGRYKHLKKNEGYKITNVFIGKSYKSSNKINFGYNFYTSNDLWVNSTEFYNIMNAKDPSWWTRILSVSDNKDFNGKYVLYVYLKESTNLTNSYLSLYKIESIPSQSQIDDSNKKIEDYNNKMEAMEKNLEKHTEIIHAVAQDKYNDSKNKLDARIKDSFKGYTYHGFDNSITNEEQLINNALIPNHIYYIKNFVLDGGWGKFYSSRQKKYYYKQVDFKTTEIKSVLASGKTSDVIITVSTSGTPVIIGLVDEIANEEMKQMKHYAFIFNNPDISTRAMLLQFNLNYTETKYNQLLNELKIYEEELGIGFNE